MTPFVGDEHDGERAGVRIVDQRTQHALAVGGLASWAHALLGAGWLDDDGKGGPVSEPIGTEELAQRALGDVFEQLERIGALGREKCRCNAMMYSASRLTPEQRLKRHEAVKLLRFAENALDYARVHLDYLDCEPVRIANQDEVPCSFRAGESVLITRPSADSWYATVAGMTGDGDLIVETDDGEKHVEPLHSVRKVAV